MKKFGLNFPLAIAAGIFCVLLGCSANVFAQRNALDTFTITNARIVTVSGADIERGTIIVRDGLIFAVGANLQVPADSRVIDGTGLTVYPGFVDAHSNLGIAAPRPQTGAPGAPGAPVAAQQQQQQPNQAVSNSIYPVGFQPEISAADLIRPSDTAFETARNNGFTTALTVPRERIFVGQSALINLAGDNASIAIVRAPVALHVALVPLQTGTYPTSLMGTFSALRQVFLDAQNLQDEQKNYEKNPRGLRRPESNKSLEALFPLINRQIPVVMQADTEREILRALDLAREFNLRAMISGGGEAHKVAERLRTQDVPVLLSLNFPKRTTTASPEADPESMEILRLRVETPKTAGRLAQAKVRFAFQSGGMTNLADFWSNAGKAVENGLSRSDALRAMTLSAAGIFGVDNRMGSIETGKIANLTVTRGDVFDKNRTFTHVFIDGKMFEIKQTPRPPAGTGAPGTTPPGTAPAAGLPNLTGNWALTVEIPNQSTPVTLNLTQQENRLTGNMVSPFGTSEITRGEVTAEGFRFVTVVTMGETIDVTFTGTVRGNQMTGTATTPQGTVPFSGTRNP